MSIAIKTSTATAVSIPVANRSLDGDLFVPIEPRGIVLFAHGSGSSRHSPRNRFVAHALQERGLATLLMDLLTQKEEIVDDATGGSLRFDVGLLAARLAGASDWVRRNPSTLDRPIGYFGASTGAAAALVAAAAEWRGEIGAVVSRGGRPDLADGALREVRAPTLLIVGSQDRVVLKLNRQALTELRCEKRLAIVPGATHLFDEPGTLEHVATLAGAWFERHLKR